MKEKTRVRLHTEGRLNWADGKTGVIEVTESAMAPEGTFVVRIDGMDVSTPPFGLVNVYAHEVEIFPEKKEEDMVNHPSHYTDGQYECIDYMEARGYTLDGYVFNAVKYLSRAGKKDPNKKKEDIQKAIWYLERKREYCAHSRVERQINPDDYIRDKGLENTLCGMALKMIDHNEIELAIDLLKMEVSNG